MVFQASEKNVQTQSVGVDFSDLERVKRAEDKSIKDLAAAEKNADKIMNDAIVNFNQYKNKMLTDLKLKLDQELKFEEQKAIEEAKKTRAEGELEAQSLEDQVQAYIPSAVEHIVKAVIGQK